MIDLNRIYNEDCLEGMKRIPDGSVDMILCDLPYGQTECEWDSVIPFAPLWEQYWRVLKPNGAVLICTQQPFTTDVINSARKHFRYELIWDKVSPVGFLNAKKMPMRRHENVVVFYRNLPTYNPQKTQGRAYKKHRNEQVAAYAKMNPYTYNNTGLINPASIIVAAKDNCIGSNSERKKNSKHPTQKPVSLFAWLIRTYTNPGHVVLDSCIGSGTTAIACLQEGRQFIGYENNTEYFNIANKRIAYFESERANNLFPQ